MSDDIKKRKFLVHSKGPNWIHFRTDINSSMEAFTVTYVWDGTVVVTGDYGTLCWRRHYDDSPDYGFPGIGTNIGYFAEKICNYGVEQKIREFTIEAAIEDVRYYAKEYVDDANEMKDKLDKFEEAIQYMEDYQEYDVLSEFREIFDDTDYYPIGVRYTWHFKFMFNCLCSVSEDIVRELGGKSGK